MLETIFPKMHAVASYAMFFFIALIVVENDIYIRALLLLPTVLLFMLSKVLYSMDQANSLEDILKRQKKLGKP